MIRSNTFPGLLVSVTPLSLEHFPQLLFLCIILRYDVRVSCLGVYSFSWIMLEASVKISLIFLFASVNVSLGMSSGPMLFSCSVFMSAPIYLEDICFGSSGIFFLLFGVFFLLLCRCILSSSHFHVPGLSWYRFSKYSSMCPLVF